MRDGGGGDVAAPGILQRHRDAHAHAEVAGLLDFREAAELADLQIHHVHREVGLGAQQDVEVVDVFIEHERMRHLAAHGEAFLVGQARLLDVDIHVAHGLRDAHGFVLHPAGVGVGHEPVAGLELRGDGVDARDVHIRIAADLELEAAITFRAIARDLRRHLLRRLLRDGAIKMHVLAVAAAEQFAHRQSASPGRECPSTRCRCRSSRTDGP